MIPHRRRRHAPRRTGDKMATQTKKQTNKKTAKTAAPRKQTDRKAGAGLARSYPYYLANQAVAANTDLDVLDKYTGKVAVRVLPSPVPISEILP